MFGYQWGRSKDDYGDSDDGPTSPPCSVKEILLLPITIPLAALVTAWIILAPLFYLIYLGLEPVVVWIKKMTKPKRILTLLAGGILLILVILYAINRFAPSPLLPPSQPQPTVATIPTLSPVPTLSSHTVEILVDDFIPQPYQGETSYFYSRLEGDRGALNNSQLVLGKGQVQAKITAGNSWGGIWMSLNHPIREGLGVNFSAVLPTQIAPAFQSQVTGITVQVVDGTPGRIFRIELKEGNALRWKSENSLKGGPQTIEMDLPALSNINQLVLVLDRAASGDFVTLARISLTAVTTLNNTATMAFAWSYSMLLNNWNPSTGLVRDKAKDASGEFDAVQSTGSLAAATAAAEQLGVVSRDSAVAIVNKIGDALVNKLPRFHGLWPHWVRITPAGEFNILPGTEWSSVDTVIAAIGLLNAQTALGLDTAATERMIQEIAWDDLLTPQGLSHGYTYAGKLIPYAWDAFGGESWLVELAYAAATGKVALLAYPNPPTANGSGFIDELAWVFAPPPAGRDYWGADWAGYRASAVAKQAGYPAAHESGGCLAKAGLFGVSAGEVPDPAQVPKNEIYQAFGLGGQFSLANDGAAQWGSPVVTPHYSAMVASLQPESTLKMWDWLIAHGHFSPLNNVESLVFPASSGCNLDGLVWNQLKGSWNLALQTLGWARNLANRQGLEPAQWSAVLTNSFLRRGYLILAPEGAAPPARQYLWTLSRECEYPDEANTGMMIWRSGASSLKVHGQFNGGSLSYRNLRIPQTDHLYIKVRYSKYSQPETAIRIYLDDESAPRASFIPINQGNWDAFTWTEPLLLGAVSAGTHALRFATGSQQYGVADLDIFTLMAGPTLTEPTLTPSPVPTPTITPTPTPPPLSSLKQVFERECEEPDVFTVGQLLNRSNASGGQVHGQFGALTKPPWNPANGMVVYRGIELPASDELYLRIRYSKATSASVPIYIYLDARPDLRAVFFPADQFGWENFLWSEPIRLGSIRAGTYSIFFRTAGQQYSVADLDKFSLLILP